MVNSYSNLIELFKEIKNEAATLLNFLLFLKAFFGTLAFVSDPKKFCPCRKYSTNSTQSQASWTHTFFRMVDHVLHLRWWLSFVLDPYQFYCSLKRKYFDSLTIGYSDAWKLYESVPKPSFAKPKKSSGSDKSQANNGEHCKRQHVM